ncbi:hypothetical protein ACFOOK_04320 [Micromonospora krabiensis]|uniref:Uncharacterized protein n=1 Tax=Micromonospora krabiensis TaxID=307121 RepID=A0A1C3NDW2_9ACTN|nr:hypothetical protein [Micromonospora krabiensis]SBV30782.1 hypothetical protein GA0070620_6384 [Micromonospora krabiensis]
MSIVEALTVVPTDWNIDWGSVPDWFGGLGTVGTLLFGVLSVRRELRARRREDRAAQARQARLVSTTTRTEGGGVLRVRVANDSDGPIFDLAATPVVHTGQPGPDGRRVAVATVTGPLDRLDGGTAAELFVAVDRSVDLTRYASATVQLTFTDQQGNRWRREGTGQPEPDLGDEPTGAARSWPRRLWSRLR